MAQQFRDAIKLGASPRWLRAGLAEKILYVFGLMCDTIAETCVQAIKRRMPGAPGVPGDALDLIGRDRKIRRGRLEAESTYATRLRSWLDTHRTRGGPYALLAQLAAYYAASPFRVWLVYATGALFAQDTAGAVTRPDSIGPFDGNVAQWARWWLVYDWPTAVFDENVWGETSSSWGDGGVWGIGNLSVEDVSDLRLVPSEWGNAHSMGAIVLLSSGGALWGIPDGGTWGDGDVWGGGNVVQIDVPT